MSIQKRLARLEGNQNQAFSSNESEEVEANMIQVIQSMNNGTYKRSSKPWVIRPVPPDADPITAIVHNQLNRMAEREQKKSERA